MRYTIMVVRVFAPAIMCGCVAGILDVAINRIAVDALVAPIAEAAKWILLLALAGMAAFLAYATWRYSRWETGLDLACSRCGGLLGELRSGRYRPFRRCFACSGAESVQH